LSALNSIETQSTLQTGYYGKFPGRGDFVSSHLSREFIEPWDMWLQSAIAASRNRLLDKWLETYLTSPIWCFYLSSGVCSRQTWAGVMMPSVDKVGRYFPLTMVCPVPVRSNPFTLMVNRSQWFIEAENLLLTILDDNVIDLDEFDRQVDKLACHLDAMDDHISKDEGIYETLGMGPNWRLPLASIEDVQMSSSELSRRMLEARFSTYSLWWSNGSEQVEPSLLISSGLPSSESFSSLLDGQWQEGAWEDWPSISRQTSQYDLSVNSSLESETTLPRDLLPELLSDLLLDNELEENDVTESVHKLDSSACTHVGKIRTVNEDAFLDRPEIGLWAVADGMGGHAAGDLASAMTVFYLNAINLPGDLNEFISNVKNKLLIANQKLFEMSQERDMLTIGCTVAVLMVSGSRAAYLWAGDSRIYLIRDGELQQLTKDHCEEDPGDSSSDVGESTYTSSVITRAVGAENELEMDVGYIELFNNDRFLLCSDGLNKEVTDDEIAEFLAKEKVLDSTQELIDLTLQRGARDNVTVVTVHISASEVDNDQCEISDT